MTNKEAALEFLYKELKRAKIALGQAESRPGVACEELENIRKKIRAIDWLTPLANKEDDVEI